MDINNINEKINMITSQNTTASAKAAANTGTDFDDVLKKASEAGDSDKLREVCDQFESIFINMMFKDFRGSISDDSLIPRGQGEKIFESMLDEELSNEMAKSGSFGISNVMYQQLAKQYGFDDEAVDKTEEKTEDDSARVSIDLKG